MDKDTKFGCSLTLIVLCVVGAIIVLSRWEKTEDVLVIGHHWSVEQQVENFLPRQLEGWDESVPGDAYNTSCQRRSRGSHEVCTGTGDDRTCTRITDYDQWCNYTADRWGYAWSEINEGDRVTDAITQPEPSTRCTGVSEIGCERYGVLLRTFTVQFQRLSDNSRFGCNYDRQTWQSFALEHTYTMVFGAVFNEARCGVVQP